MPRAPRVNLEGALYYVTSRTIQGQYLFNDREDYLMYEDLLAKYKNQHGFKLFAFALVPTHVHLLVETMPETTLSEIMHNITSSYTKYYNKKYGRRGHLFRGRFRAVVIEKEPNLLRLTRYIHLNPKKLNLAQELDGYQYSTYPLYLNKKDVAAARIDIGAEINEVSSYLNGAAYESYMSQDCVKENKELHEELKRKVFLGSEEFVRQVQEKIGKPHLPKSAKDQEARAYKKEKKAVITLISGLVVITLGVSVLLYANRLVRKTAVVLEPKVQTVVSPVIPAEEAIIQGKNSESAIEEEVTGLDGLSWQVKFVAGTPFQSIDIITFDSGRMLSENMNLNGYQPSNYSMTKDGDRIIWETMQTSKDGVALWHGEVENKQMKGVLNLRQKDGEPKDFSFVSTKYSRL